MHRKSDLGEMRKGDGKERVKVCDREWKRDQREEKGNRSADE